MLSHLRPAFVMMVCLTLLTGLVYPYAITGLARALFPWQAGGSLVRDGDRVIGSALIGQSFTSDAYFHGRPSAAGKNGYDASSSGGSNLGPTSRALHDRASQAVAALKEENPGQPVPDDLVAASASGLDPDITPAGAGFQVAHVAHARGLEPARVQEVVDEVTQGRLFEVLGEPRVNVLALNMALDAKFGRPTKEGAPSVAGQ